jgi:hypothetical protein
MDPPSRREGMSWKSDYLQLQLQIQQFLAKHFSTPEPATVEYHGHWKVPNTVGRLTKFHLEMAAELLHASVNGGLEEAYIDDYEKIRKAYPLWYNGEDICGKDK